MATTRPVMARLALLAALLAQLQPTLASFYTVTSYFALSESVSTYASTRSYTYTDTITLYPTVTPTASAISSRTRTDTYYDLEVVSIFVAASALASSDLAATTTPPRASGVYTDYGVPVTWTAPSSCPTPFTVVTVSDVYIPYEVEPYITAASTATSVYSGSTTTYTWITYILDATQIPSSARPGNSNPTSEYYYSYYVANCRNPTATGAAYWGPNSGSSSGGDDYSGGDDDYWDWTACSALTGCVSVKTWVIVVATILPTIFLLGFVESYFWFRRMMLGKSALRLGTVCWCCLSLWFILLTRKSPARSKEDQVLLRQYWATLGFGTRVKFWFKHGFAWRYPVELLGNPDGNNPVVVQQVAAGGVPPSPAPGQQGDGAGGDGAEKMQGVVNAQQQPVYMPYPGQAYMQPVPGQPYPGQPYPGQPGFAPPQGYVMMAVPPQQGAYLGQQPGFVPAPPVSEMGDGLQQQQQPGQQQQYPPYIPSPSPVHTGTTEVPSVQTGATELPSAQPTPSPGPGHEQQPPAPPGQQPPPH